MLAKTTPVHLQNHQGQSYSDDEKVSRSFVRGRCQRKAFFLNLAFSPLLLLLLSCSVCNLNLLLPNDLSNHPFLKKMRTGGLANFRRFFAISHNLSPCVGAKWFTYHPLSFLFSTPISKKGTYPKKTYWHRFCCSWAIMISSSPT